MDDVLGGDEMWAHADSTDGDRPPHCRTVLTLTPCHSVPCDKCNNKRAYFYQLQIRSADEPMTTCASVSVVDVPLADSLDSLQVSRQPRLTHPWVINQPMG